MLGVLIYLYAAPLGCDNESLVTPPWLYGTLFASLLLEFAVVISDAIIMSKSCRGRIDHTDIVHRDTTFHMVDGGAGTSNGSRTSDPDSAGPRRTLKRYLFLRIVLFLLEFVLSGMYGYACWSPGLTDQLLRCDEFRGPIYFARAVAVAWWLILVVSSIFWLVFLDPVGVCSPGLLDQMGFLDEEEDDEGDTDPHFGKVHRAHLGSRRIRRRLNTLLCCCLCCTKHRERGLAIEDTARVLHSLFDDVDVVGSDLVAGLILLNKDQKRKMRAKQCLITDFKEVGMHVAIYYY